jgi:hypothetical protein
MTMRLRRKNRSSFVGRRSECASIFEMSIHNAVVRFVRCSRGMVCGICWTRQFKARAVKFKKGAWKFSGRARLLLVPQGWNKKLDMSTTAIIWSKVV